MIIITCKLLLTNISSRIKLMIILHLVGMVLLCINFLGLWNLLLLKVGMMRGSSLINLNNFSFLRNLGNGNL